MLENASNSVKLNELLEKKEEVSQQLDEKMDRWVYLNDLNGTDSGKAAKFF